MIDCIPGAGLRIIIILSKAVYEHLVTSIKVTTIMSEIRTFLIFIKSKVEENNCIYEYNKHDYIYPPMDSMGEPTKS